MHMADKDAALAILQAAIAGAGLLLIFAGFLLARGEQFERENARRSIRRLAKAALVPLLAAMTCTWIGVLAAEGDTWSQQHLYPCFQLVLVVSALYAVIALLRA
jgi:cytochrome bd-type quinol oxidase subunit 2